MITTHSKYREGGNFLKEHVMIVKPDMGLKYPSIPAAVKPFMPTHQQRLVSSNISEYQNEIAHLENVIGEMPKTYETDGIKLNDKIAYLHYFQGGSDWWIFEKDKGDPSNKDFEQNQMFGYAVLGEDWDNAEAGYVSMEDINSTNKVELEFHFQPTKFSTILNKKQEKVESGEPKAPTTVVAEPVSINELLKGKNQHEINEHIRALIKEKATHRDKYSPQELQFLEYYEGSGGYAKEGEKGARILDQFFTPDEIIKKMWGLAIKYGFTFKDSCIIEPSVGIGRFLKYIPANEVDAVHTFEVDNTAWSICELLYPRFKHHLESFESMFFKGKRHVGIAGIEKFYDLVIGNPPYREYISKYSPLGEKKATEAFTFDQYFLMRGIDVLKPEGLLVYIIPSSFMNNKVKYNSFKEKLAAKADLLDAYRLPSGVFGATEVTTDIIVLKKKS